MSYQGCSVSFLLHVLCAFGFEYHMCDCCDLGRDQSNQSLLKLPAGLAQRDFLAHAFAVACVVGKCIGEASQPSH